MQLGGYNTDAYTTLNDCKFSNTTDWSCRNEYIKTAWEGGGYYLMRSLMTCTNKIHEDPLNSTQYFNIQFPWVTCVGCPAESRPTCVTLCQMYRWWTIQIPQAILLNPVKSFTVILCFKKSGRVLLDGKYGICNFILSFIVMFNKEKRVA
jgi:hypothetical protein